MGHVFLVRLSGGEKSGAWFCAGGAGVHHYLPAADVPIFAARLGIGIQKLTPIFRDIPAQSLTVKKEEQIRQYD